MTSLFDSALSANLDAVKMEQVWNGLLGQTGPFKKAGPPVNSQKGNIDMIDQLVEFEKTNLVLRIRFDAKDKICTFLFLPANSMVQYVSPPYADKGKFEEKEIMVRTGDYELPGTLTIPKDVKNFPIVILIHGSGPNDRDETIGGIKVFKDIAYGLSSNGIAVIRYEKRTRVYGTKSGKNIDSLTVEEEVTDDAASAVRLAKTIPGVDTTKIFLLGHSLGAMLMPRMAADIKGLAGVIMMAGNARPLEDVYLEQVTYLLNADGNFSKEDREKLEIAKTQSLRVKNLGRGNPFPPASDLPLNINAKYWYEMKNYDQVETAKKLRLPIFIMQGERDYQVTMTDFNLWQQSMYYSKNVRYNSYPKLDHPFVEGEGKSNPQDYEKQANLPDYVINDIASFIKSH
jgi:dienelactone hydrolase